MSEMVIGEKTSISMKVLFIGIPALITAVLAYGDIAFQSKANANEIMQMKMDNGKFQRVVIKHLTKLEDHMKVKGRRANEDFEEESDF